MISARKTSEARLVASAIAVIDREGVDGVSVGRVSEGAGLTRPTFYAYFESMPGLLATMWIERGPEWLATLSNPSAPAEPSDPAERRQHRALVEILATAHRTPEVLEVVQPTVATWWSTVAAQGQFHAEKTSWLVSQRLGSAITTPIEPAAASSAVLGDVLSSLPQVPSSPDGRELQVDGPSLSVFDPVGGSDDTERLVLAAIDVIARSGVRGASMARIARRAQVSTGAIYPKFPSIDDVIDQSFEYAMRAIVADNLARVHEAGSPHDYGVVILSGLSPSRRTWRDFRIEIHLEARHRASLADRLAAGIRESNEVLIDSSTFMSALPRETAAPLPHLIHCLGIGLSVLQNAGVPVGVLDHPRLSVEVGAQLRRMGR